MAVCNTTDEAHCYNGGACIEGPGILFTCRCLPGNNLRCLAINQFQ